MTSPLLTLLGAADLRRHYAAGAWRDETVYDIVCGHARGRPDAPAIRDSRRLYTWRQLRDAVDAFAADLAARGVRSGQRVLVWAPNRIETVVALIAASRNGIVCCPSPHRNHTVAEIAELVRRTSCAAFIHQAGHGADADARDIEAEIAGQPSLRHVYRLAEGAPDAPFAGLLDATAAAPAPAPAPLSDPDRVTYLAFTSGSTGAPKGVMHSDNTQLVSARGIASDWNLGPDTVTLSLSPFSHNLGCGTLWTSLVAGGTFVLHDWPRGDSLLDRIEATGTDYLVGVPTHAMDLLAELDARGIDRFDRLRGFRVSGAACPAHVAAALLDRGIPTQKGYGMTETNGHQYTLPGDSRERILETSGRSCAGFELRIFDERDSDRPLAPGRSGQLGVRGACLMLGYFGDQAATEAAMNGDGWFMTGDLGTLDDAGYLRLTGRKKELIIRGGHNINPNQLEDLALRHPAVDLVAAVPVPSERLGEQACLAVKLAPGARLSPQDMLAHLATEGLSKYDIPEFWLEVEDIPLMPNGKMEKLEILRRLRAGDLVPVAIRVRARA